MAPTQILPEILACLAGLLLLAYASDALVLNASVLAGRLGVPTVVVGVVVIGFGTSAPELLVSALAATGGSAAIGVGNLVGSNIANVTLVLGCAALVAPVVIRSGLIRREVPLSLAACVAAAIAVQSGITRPEAVGLLLGLAVALGLLLRWGLRATTVPAPADADEETRESAEPDLAEDVDDHLEDENGRRSWVLCVLAVLGLVGTVAGAEALVWGAQGMAGAVGLSEGFVGLTVVAVGTSLPELVTAVQSVRHGETDLLIGNLMGSNMFNALGVGGTIGLLAPGVVVDPAVARTGVLVMLGTAALATVFMVTGRRVNRWEGAALLVVFAACMPFMV